MPGKPLWDKDLIRHAGLVQLRPGLRKLPGSLYKIACVCPKADMILRDDQVTLPRVAGEPSHLMPAGGGILTVVRVIPRHDDGIPTLRAHHSPNRLNPFLEYAHVVIK